MTHTFTYLAAHAVFGTKDRAPLIVPEIKEDLFAYIGGIVREEGEEITHISRTRTAYAHFVGW